MTHKIDVFYTGGGIALAEVILDEDLYAVVGNDAPEHFTIYKRVEEDEEQYMPEDMVASKHHTELTEEHKELFNRMIVSLKERGYLE